jgi:molecular chaperone IbpA
LPTLYCLIISKDTEMRAYDFSPLYRSAIGFDRLAKLLDATQRSESEISYPPYNVELISEHQYRIVMAVAGFSLDDLDIEYEHQSLKVSGEKPKRENQPTYLHRGIASRDFEHKFQLADHVKVTNAKLENGLLEIQLERQVPEALKPKKVKIESHDNKLIDKKAA